MKTKYYVLLFLAFLAFSLVGSTASGQAAARNPDASSGTAWRDIYRYQMKGLVRVLFFWLGRDDVGGGHVSYVATSPAADGSFLEGTEVLFGSRPDRVPGRINRWGYGQELTYWTLQSDDTNPCAQESIFEGFMRHSGEESLSDVQAADRNEKAESLFWYDGIRSQVTSEEAGTEIVYFSHEKDFDYNEFQPVIDAYHSRRAVGPPDKTGALERVGGAPIGFLSAVRTIMRAVSDRYHAEDPEWQEHSYALAYAYNAKAYRLQVDRLRLHRTLPGNFEDTPPDGLGASALENVIEGSFRITATASGNTRKFSVWFPSERAYREVPLRIVDQPRWWLRVELNLREYSREAITLQSSSFSGIAQIPRGVQTNCISPAPE
jgi:hypothetical protein